MAVDTNAPDNGFPPPPESGLNARVCTGDRV
jgi:hypothetical protein